MIKKYLASFQEIKSRFFPPEQKIEIPRICYVYGCEFTKDEIFCGVKKEGVAIKEDKENYWVLLDGDMTPYKKNQVMFE